MENERVVFNVPFSKINICTGMTIKRGGWYRQHHLHAEAEMIRVLDGGIVMATDRGNLPVRSGETVFVNGGVMHHVVPGTDASHCMMIQTIITEDWEQQEVLYSLISAQGPCGTAVFGPGTEVSALISEIAAEAEGRKKGFELFVRADIAKIAAILLRGGVLPDFWSFANSDGFKKLAPAIEYIDRRCAQRISLKEVAEVANFDRFYFCKLFRSTCRITFTEYVNSVRLFKAEQLLRRGSSVTAAAYETGFACTQYFGRCFKERYGCPPSAYKKQLSGAEPRPLC